MTDYRLIHYWVKLAEKRYDITQNLMFHSRKEYIQTYVQIRESEWEVHKNKVKTKKIDDIIGHIY